MLPEQQAKEIIACDFDLMSPVLSQGPLGGDQQMGAYISDDKLDMVIFWEIH